VRRPFTTAQARANGLTKDALRWAVRGGDIQRIERGVYVKSREPVTAMEYALAILILTGGTASRSLAGILHGLDSVTLSPPFVACAAQPRVNRPEVEVRRIRADRVVNVRGYSCCSALQTLLDLAALMTDIEWEQALESILRKKLLTISDIQATLPELSRARTPGVNRIRRVLTFRPPDAPPTGSVLETMAVQLIRSDSSLPTPTRQVEVRNRWDEFVAYVDLAFPEYGVFLELDGSGHKDQPQYDATRQTAVVAAKKWLVGRFSWNDITRCQRQTLRRLHELLD
jgi:hypothetical protein